MFGFAHGSLLPANGLRRLRNAPRDWHVEVPETAELTLVTDRHTPAQRSYNMSRIRGFDTSIEITMRNALKRRRLRHESNVQSLPGRPDIVFRRARLVIFIDGDFWHGYRFPLWRARLSPFWQAKIDRNRLRDRRNHQALRREGWRVIRIWEHQLRADLDKCADRIQLALRERRNSSSAPDA